MKFEKNNLKIINADCMDIIKGYEDNYFDLAIVDPPYGIERFKRCSEKDIINSKTKKSKSIASRFQKMETINNNKPNSEYWNELFRVSKHQIIWGANNFTLPESEYFLVWDKKQPMPNLARCELAYVSMSLKKPAKIFEYSIHKHNKTKKIHNTQKPLKLYEFILKYYAHKEFKILDTHLGSASSAIAAFYYGCKEFVGIEIDENYYNDSIKRIKEQTVQLKLL